MNPTVRNHPEHRLELARRADRREELAAAQDERLRALLDSTRELSALVQRLAGGEAPERRA